MATSSAKQTISTITDKVDGTSPDVLRTMVRTFAQASMSAEADAICGTDYRQRSEERVNSRNGYRTQEWDTRRLAGRSGAA